MSFFSRYWKQVERQVKENYMNPGDVHVDINAMCNNTDEADNVVPQPESVKPEVQPKSDRPAKDEPMSRYAPNPAAWETQARRSARCKKKGDRVEREDFEETTRRRVRVDGHGPRRRARAREKNQAEAYYDFRVD